MKAAGSSGQPAVGLVFDGDGDRIAAVDESGTFCSTQQLMPLLIDHLARARQLPGSVVKTVSGSDLMRLVAEDLGREVLELPVGFKYIASEMLEGEVLIGGEESGGVGFGMHLPERDALLRLSWCWRPWSRAANLGARVSALQQRCGGNSHYDRVDLRLPDMATRHRLEQLLAQQPPMEIAGSVVQEVITTDGDEAAARPEPLVDAAFLGHRALAAPLLRSAQRRAGR